jgi:hypothetical protein
MSSGDSPAVPRKRARMGVQSDDEDMDTPIDRRPSAKAARPR